MRTPLSSFNLSQNLFSVYFREALCYDEFETSNNFDLELKTKSPKTEVLGLESDDTNRGFSRLVRLFNPAVARTFAAQRNNEISWERRPSLYVMEYNT